MANELVSAEGAWSAQTIWLVIIAAGALTYLTRVGGYLVISMFGSIPPRAAAALDAVPAAVLTAIVSPVLVSGGWPERIVIILCAVLSLRLPLIAVVVIGTVLVAGARALGF